MFHGCPADTPDGLSWGTRIRTLIARARIWRPAIRRSPNGSVNIFLPPRPASVSANGVRKLLRFSSLSTPKKTSPVHAADFGLSGHLSARPPGPTSRCAPLRTSRRPRSSAGAPRPGAAVPLPPSRCRRPGAAVPAPPSRRRPSRRPPRPGAVARPAAVPPPPSRRPDLPPSLAAGQRAARDRRRRPKLLASPKFRLPIRSLP